MNFPILSTERLELRALTPRDLETALAHWSDREVGRWLFDGRAPEREKVEDELRQSRELFARHGLGVWGVYRPPDRLIGTCGFLRVAEVDEIEILFSLDPGAWGHGYAFEASIAALDRAFRVVGLERVIGRCDVPNEPSRRLLERLGMKLEKREPIRGLDSFHFALSRDDYLRRRGPAAG